MLPENRKKNKLSYRFFDPLPVENNNKKQNFECSGASRHHRHLVSVCVIINHQCAIVSLERVQNRAVLVWVPPLLKVQCCQRSRRCQHGTLSHHRTADGTPGWWYVIPASPASVHRKKTLTTLNFAMVTSEKTVLPTVSEKTTRKHQLAWWARTRARVFVCGSKFRFRLFRFLLLWWLRTWTWTQ